MRNSERIQTAWDRDVNVAINSSTLFPDLYHKAQAGNIADMKEALKRERETVMIQMNLALYVQVAGHLDQPSHLGLQLTEFSRHGKADGQLHAVHEHQN